LKIIYVDAHNYHDDDDSDDHDDDSDDNQVTPMLID